MIKKNLRRVWTVLKHLLFYYPLYGLSFLTPRKKNRWIFGTGKSMRDNSKYLFIEIIEKHKDIDAIWLVTCKKNLEDLKEKGLHAYYLYSFQGLYYLFTANIYISSYYLDEFLPIWTLGRAKHVNLWHGIALKNIGIKGNSLSYKKILQKKLLKPIYIALLLHIFRKPDLFLVTSEATKNQFQYSLDLKGTTKLINSHYPRCMPLIWDSQTLS